MERDEAISDRDRFADMETICRAELAAEESRENR
jgi:hypothetical protein